MGGFWGGSLERYKLPWEWALMRIRKNKSISAPLVGPLTLYQHFTHRARERAKLHLQLPVLLQAHIVHVQAKHLASVVVFANNYKMHSQLQYTVMLSRISFVIASISLS